MDLSILPVSDNKAVGAFMQQNAVGNIHCPFLQLKVPYMLPFRCKLCYPAVAVPVANIHGAIIRDCHLPTELKAYDRSIHGLTV